MKGFYNRERDQILWIVKPIVGRKFIVHKCQ